MFHGQAVGALEQQKKLSVMKPAIRPNGSEEQATPMWRHLPCSLETIVLGNG
jgi:hypothetical protein